MLTLSRRPGESLYLFPADTLPEGMTVRELFENGPIEIAIQETGCQVRLGINAPKDILVLRDELLSPSDLEKVISCT